MLIGLAATLTALIATERPASSPLIALQVDGDTLLVTTASELIRLDGTSGTVVSSWHHQGSVFDAATSRDGLVYYVARRALPDCSQTIAAAWDPSSGRLAWMSKVPSGPWTSIVVLGSRGVLLLGGGAAAVLTAETGKLRWLRTFDSSSVPIVLDDAILGSEGARLEQVHFEDAPSARSNVADCSAPLAAQNELVFCHQRGAIEARSLHRTSGDLVWTATVAGNPDDSNFMLAHSAGSIVLAAWKPRESRGSVQVLDPLSGRQHLEIETAGVPIAGLVLKEEILLLIAQPSGNAFVTSWEARDRASGRLSWRRAGERIRRRTPIDAVATRELVFLPEQASIVAVERGTGVARWEFVVRRSRKGR